MITDHYRKLHQKFVIAPLTPIINKFTPSVIICFKCTLGIFLSILYWKGYLWLTLALVLASNMASFFRTLDSSLPKLEVRPTPGTNMLQAISDRIVEMVMFFTYYILDTESSVRLLWILGYCFALVTVFAMILSSMKKVKPAN